MLRLCYVYVTFMLRLCYVCSGLVENMKKEGILLLCGCLLLSGCQLFSRKHNAGVAVEVNGHFLEYSELDQLTAGLSGEDSAAVADAFIRQWATEILMYDKAKNKVDNKPLEALVEDYRHSLYMHAYEQYLVSHRPQSVPQAKIDSFYKTHKDRYVLKDNIMKGLLLIVPNGTPDLEKVKRQMQHPDEANIEKIEKYAYRYATGYELFLDEWKPMNQLLLWMHVDKNSLSRALKQNPQVTVSDSISTYILQVTEQRQAGEVMPIEYAQAEIEPVLLREVTTAYIKSERDRIYEDAVRFKKVKFYEESH